MAIRYAVATGNWSAVGTWDGGDSLPTVGDDVYANGFTVTLNQDITVTKISTEVCPITSVGGGKFSTTTAERTLVCNIVSGLSSCIDTLAGVKNIIGNIYGSNTGAFVGIYMGNVSTLNIVGNLIPGNFVGAYAIHFPHIYGSGTLNLTGNAAANAYAQAFFCIANAGSFIANITGNVTSSASYTAIENISNLTFNGVAQNTGIKRAIQMFKANDTAILSGIIYYSDSGYPAINPTISFIAAGSSLSYIMKDILGGSYTLTNSENPPAITDVRSGIVYGIGDAYEGTCAVPPATSVALNVPVDNTVGELVTATTPADFIAALKADDLGVRLGKCATTAEVDSTIAAYNT